MPKHKQNHWLRIAKIILKKRKKAVLICAAFFVILLSGLFFQNNLRQIALNYFILKGEYYFNGGAYDTGKAQKMFNLASYSSPKTDYVHYQLARIHFVENKLDLARQEIDKALSLNPENQRAYYIRGLIDGYDNKFEDAISDFQKFVAWSPTEWAGYNDLAWAYFKNNNYEKAREIAQAGLDKTDSQNPWLLNGLGVAYINLGESKKAEEIFSQVKKNSESMTPEKWASAYPGNDPEASEWDLNKFKADIDSNAKLASAGFTSGGTVVAACASSTCGCSAGACSGVLCGNECVYLEGNFCGHWLDCYGTVGPNCSGSGSYCSGVVYGSPNGCGNCTGTLGPDCSGSGNYYSCHQYASPNGCGTCTGTYNPSCDCAANTCVGSTCSNGCYNCAGTLGPNCAGAWDVCSGTVYPSPSGCGTCIGTKNCCAPSCANAPNVCSGTSFSDGCGGTCWGTKNCSCTPNCSNNSNVCSGTSYNDGCGGTCWGTKNCSCTPNCSNNSNVCSGTSYDDNCGGDCWGTKNCSSPVSLSLSASPSSVGYNGSSTLTWNVSSADWCWAWADPYLGAWDGGADNSNGRHNQSTGGLTTDETFYIECGSSGGSVTRSRTVTVGAPPVSSCNLPWGGSIASGASVTAYQASSVPCGSSCTSQTRTCNNGTLSGSYTNQNCSVAACSVSVTLTSAPANPITYNTSATLTWTPSGATSCTATGAWSGSKASSNGPHTQSTGNLTSNRIYNIECSNSSGTSSGVISRTVTVAACVPNCNCAAGQCTTFQCFDGCTGLCFGDVTCCVPDLTCRDKTCLGKTCSDGCGGTVQGRKKCIWKEVAP